MDIEGGLSQPLLASLLPSPARYLEHLDSGLLHSQVVRDTKLAAHKAAAANDFKQRLDHDLQQHASMAHKIVRASRLRRQLFLQQLPLRI